MEDDIYSMVHCLIETLFFFFWLKLSFLDLKTLTKLIIFQKNLITTGNLETSQDENSLSFPQL